MRGRGDVLDVEFEVKNLIDDPQELYIFVIATFEAEPQSRSSFSPLLAKKNTLRSFVPYPDDITNFEYEDPDSEGKVKLIKYPKNPGAGIDENTGKPYHLKDKLFIRTKHLARYKNNYYYFNRVWILVYDKDEKPIFRQGYKFIGIRR